jgi:hypothetical protein
MFPPGPPVMRERYLFRSAVYDISLYGYSVLVPVVRISKSLPLRSLITRLFRLTENKLRELLGLSRRLKGVKLDADMEELVIQYLQREFQKARQEEKGPAVVIDEEKLERLQADSDVVRTLLTVQDLGYTEEVGNSTEPKPMVANTTDKIATDKEVNEITFMDVKSQSEDDATEEETQPVGGSMNNNDPTEKSKVLQSTDGGSESSEWELLAEELSSLQRDAVLTLAGNGGWAGLQVLAAANGTMAELLIDEINIIAMDMLGDLLIDGEEIPAEYVPMLSYLKR